MIHILNRSVNVTASTDVVWKFIENPKNLNRITPKDMSFKILTDLPEGMYNGLLIQYKVSIPLFGRWNWVTEIKHIQESKSFVDEQRVGPYKFWYHYHEVQPHPKGTTILDQVTYQLPYGLLGEILNTLIVKRQLDTIFDYREQVFHQLLGDSKDSHNHSLPSTQTDP